MSVDLSIIIVNWNTRTLLAQCLEHVRSSVENSVGRGVETLVIDNASTDDSAAMVREEFPWVRLIANAANAGFARANNQGIMASSGRYVLLLNSDAMLMPATLRDLATFLDCEPTAGIASVSVAFPDGLPQFCYGKFPDLPSELRSLFGMHRWDLSFWGRLDHPRKVDWVSGACLMARRTMFDEVGVLDESFFMFSEEVDLCYRAARAGWGTYVVPSAPVIHVRAGSTGMTSERVVRLYRGKRRYAGKHLGKMAQSVLIAMICVSTLGKLCLYWVLSLVKPRLRERRRLWSQVFRQMLTEESQP